MQWLEFDHANLLRNRPTSHFVAFVSPSFVCEKQRHFDFQAKTYRLQLTTKGLFHQLHKCFVVFFQRSGKNICEMHAYLVTVLVTKYKVFLFYKVDKISKLSIDENCGGTHLAHMDRINYYTLQAFTKNVN